MNWQALPYAGPLFLAAALGVVVAAVVQRRRDAPGSGALLLLVASGSLWAAAYGAAYLSAGMGAKLFWAKLAYTGATWTPFAWMIFAFVYTRRAGWLTRRTFLLLAFEPLLTIALLWTNQSHHLYWTRIAQPGAEHFPILSLGLWFWAHTVYSYVLLAVASWPLLRVLTHSLRLFRRQATVLLLVILVPWLANLLSLLPLTPVSWPDLTPYAFPIVELLLAWNLTRWHLLDVVPVARDLSVQGMSDGIVVIDRTARVVDVNPAAQRMLGWSSDELGQPVAELLLPDMMRAVRRAAGSDAGVEVLLGTPGEARHHELTLSPLRDRRGRPTGQLLALHDVEERHALLVAEQAARRAAEAAQARLAFLAEASRVLGSSLDYEVTLQRVARLAVPRLAEYCTVDLIHDDHSVSRLATAGREPAEAGWSAAVPLVARERQLGVLTLMRTDGGGDPGDEMLLAEELARRAALAIDNARLYREARAAVRVREDFVTTASHELKTPLTTIKGFTQLLNRQLRQVEGNPGRLPLTLERLTGEVARLEELVQGLLDLSRIQESRLALRPEQCDLTAIAHEAIERLQQSGAVACEQLALEATEPVAGVWDRFRLDQVITNLLSNAVKYSPAGSRISVAVRRLGEHAELAVRDAGIGIAPEEQPGLFEPFNRGVQARKLAPGTGLGLYIAAQIVRQHGGTIAVESAPGTGSTFVVQLPFTVAQGVSPTLDADPTVGSGAAVLR
ncbi:MAG TPA: histidine kinase N-terminal 7TM domain-containing protein [Thermomicrobiaceae bacterium]|nr:histidine kinase N-terminal 7TM domain-containing protein [Thermomicrobiaceae bacterium]